VRPETPGVPWLIADRVDLDLLHPAIEELKDFPPRGQHSGVPTLGQWTLGGKRGESADKELYRSFANVGGARDLDGRQLLGAAGLGKAKGQDGALPGTEADDLEASGVDDISGTSTRAQAGHADQSERNALDRLLDGTGEEDEVVDGQAALFDPASFEMYGQLGGIGARRDHLL
jgi:hypothetical protein